MREFGAEDWSSQPTNPDWSEDQTTAKWTPKHIHAVRWPKRQRIPTPEAHGSEISQVVAAPARKEAQPSSDEQAALRSKTRAIWMYSATAAVAVFSALMSSRALLGFFGQVAPPGTSAAALPAAPAFATPPSPADLPAPALAPRHRTPRAHVRARAMSRVGRVESERDEPAIDPDAEPDMSFMDAPITAREARAIAEGRARSAAKAAPAADCGAAAQTGVLRINSRPWAQLYLDGRLVGNTPQLGLSVSAGEHSVRLVNPQFVMSKSFSVVVGPAETVTRVESLAD
jgi:serine/threonine-protein kinase